jgi:hypothetical protein
LNGGRPKNRLFYVRAPHSLAVRIHKKETIGPKVALAGGGGGGKKSRVNKKLLYEGSADFKNALFLRNADVLFLKRPQGVPTSWRHELRSE